MPARDRRNADPALPFGVAATGLVVAAACGVLFVVVGVLAVATDRPFGYFSRDPASTLDGSAYVGLLSHAGVLLLWGAAVASLLAGAFVARSRGRRRASPLVAIGIATAYIALDDLLLFHERVFLHVGLDQEPVLAAYGVAALAFGWWYRSVFVEEWPLVAVAGVALAASLALDVTVGDLYWLEDSLKLVGLAFWTAYVVRLSLRMLADAYPMVEADRRATGSAPTRDAGPRA
jgi:hypothetical protein